MIDITHITPILQYRCSFMTQHASLRFRQRNISMKDIKHALITGKIIKQYEDDTPFPSCLILGYTIAGKPLHIVMSDEGTASNIITAYIPDSEKWDTTLY